MACSFCVKLAAVLIIGSLLEPTCERAKAVSEQALPVTAEQADRLTSSPGCPTCPGLASAPAWSPQSLCLLSNQHSHICFQLLLSPGTCRPRLCM